MESDMILQIVAAARGLLDDLLPAAQCPVVLADKDIRWFVKKLLEPHFRSFQ
jgi:type III secretory pathway component EscV